MPDAGFNLTAWLLVKWTKAVKAQNTLQNHHAETLHECVCVCGWLVFIFLKDDLFMYGFVSTRRADMFLVERLSLKK